MPVALTGELNADLTRLIASVKNSASFQVWVGAADAAEAADYLHSYAADTTDSAGDIIQAAFALVYLAPGWRRELVDIENEFVTDAQVILHLEGTALHTDMGDMARWMTNTMTAVMADIEALSDASGTYLNVYGWQLLEGDPELPAAEETHQQVICRAVIDVVRN